MNASDRPTESQPAPATFSLGTMFLVVSCVGVALATFRFTDGGNERIALATFYVGVFLTMWFLATLQLRRLKIVGWLWLLGAVLAVITLPSVGSHEASPYTQSRNNLRQLGIALLQYHERNGSFPPAFVADSNGKPLYSWRVLILPQLDEARLATLIRRDESWDGSNNAKWTGICPPTFIAPADPQNDKPRASFTSYVAIVGAHTAWSGATARKLSEFKNPSKTILLVEVANSGIHWAEPRDLYIGQMSTGVNSAVGQGISSANPRGAYVLFADGHIEFLPNSTDPKKLVEMLDLDGPHDTEEEGASR
jgi:prepilin-type processing-associated H-X9-DG protein